MLALSADDARRLALRAQGLLGAPDRRGGVPELLRRLGAVQLDTISVLARSHELVAYARLGAIGRASVEAAYWGRPAAAFEHWAHAACILPLAEWPWQNWRRAAARSRAAERSRADPRTCREVLARLRAEGPLTATELGGAKRGGPWWDWSDVKIAVEHLLSVGEVVCTSRRGWRRVYDLPERAIPEPLRCHEPPEDDARARLLAVAGRACGVATLDDLADYFRQGKGPARRALPLAGLTPVAVEGWDQPAYADPAALAELSSGRLRGLRHRTTLLSPFDSLVWHRPRAERIFGLRHRLEAYTPAARREFGYFAMPLLAGGRIVGRVDPAREGRTLVARQVSLQPRAGAAAIRAVGVALAEAATWVGCSAVVVERVVPARYDRAVRGAVMARVR